MAIIVTGGTGMTGIRLAALLKDANVPFVLTSRRGPAAAPGMPVVEFAWGDARTFPNPFKHFSEKVAGVYIIGPDSHPSAAASVNSFIDYAVKEHGVRRFILAGGTLLQKGGHLEMGKVWEHLDDIGVEYGALRLTWFMENFSESFKLAAIKKKDKIYTAAGDGLVPFVSASDIAAVAFRLLTDEQPPAETDYRIVGPEDLTHDQVAAKLSKCLGREIQHVKLSEQEAAETYIQSGTPEGFSKFLANLEEQTKHGMEEGTTDTVEKVIGRPGLTFDEWALQNKARWV